MSSTDTPMAGSADAITNAVLLTLFPALRRLDAYLDAHLAPGMTILRDDDPTEYRDMLHSTLVADTDSSILSTTTASTTMDVGLYSTARFPTTSQPDPRGKQSEIVRRAIEQTCPNKRSWHGQTTNILAIGYVNSRRSSHQQAENFFKNTLQTFVLSDHWETLLRRIGDEAMLFLLTGTTMFAALPNNCYCQITGPAISEQPIAKKPLQRDLLASLTSRKSARSKSKKRPASAMFTSSQTSSSSSLASSTPIFKVTPSAEATEMTALDTSPAKSHWPTFMVSKSGTPSGSQSTLVSRSNPPSQQLLASRCQSVQSQSTVVEGNDHARARKKTRIEKSNTDNSDKASNGNINTNINNIKNGSNKSSSKKVASNKALLPTILFKRTKVFYFKQYQSESAMLAHFLLSDYKSDKFTKPVHNPPPPVLETQMRRMFPKQYGLDHVFIKRSTFSLPPSLSWSSSSGSSTSSKGKDPWRLRKMKLLVNDMLDLNGKCKFKYLLQYYCPVPAIDEPSDMNEVSVPTLLTCYSSFDQVTSFVHAIVKKVIPLEMFGSVENRAVILQAMTRFIRLRKFETLSLQYAIQGFKTSHCEWLQDSQVRKPGTGVKHVPPTASEKQQEILNEFVYWLFDGFLVPLLQASFYVTDSSFQRNKVFYYRHGLWQKITKPAVSTIQKNMFIKMSEIEIKECRRLYSRVRLLPKEQDLRPIINLRRKSAKLVNGDPAWGVRAMNQQLLNAFLILAYERNRQSQRTSSALGMSDLYQRFKQVKAKLVGPSRPGLRKLYMVKVDIKKSFDSINQDKLLEIINKTLQEDRYMIHRYSKVMPSNGQIMKRFLPKAVAPSEMPAFLDYARDQAAVSKHAVMIDKVLHSYEDKAAIVNLIREHINENIVKFGRNFYRQTTGIPQGSTLSPALCRFFYDEMEKNVLSDLTQAEDSALLRLADDFLFVSKSREKAAAFLNIMAKGQPDYGCYINDKTITNFEISVNGTQFPYCGLLLHSKTLEIRADYSRYHGEDIRNLLTVGRDLHPGRSITLKMKKAMQHMCQMAFSDTTFNSLPQVMLNIYQNFIFCAMKFHAYCQELRLDPVSAHVIQPAALPSIVLSIFRACFGLLHNGRRSNIGVAAGAKFQVAERHVHWLGASAFCKVLPQTLQVYGPLRVMLHEQILGPMNRNEKVHFKRMLLSAVKDPRNDILDRIRYT
ncbi:hypothetical protein BGZ99_004568 [Dissophora globulifera]|uniref:Telomerase reverse transcriptase n=1 Tax=Dissophora globulifera TaxID=979702 RepID=A0A9P6RHF0_9FUNG|nr:hypothetical protein BGZ99_004568 [Dissophora globulifera]